MFDYSRARDFEFTSTGKQVFQFLIYQGMRKQVNFVLILPEHASVCQVLNLPDHAKTSVSIFNLPTSVRR